MQLHKALNGLKQAPQAWLGKFSSFLIHQRFFASSVDSSLFIKQCEWALASFTSLC